MSAWKHVLAVLAALAVGGGAAYAAYLSFDGLDQGAPAPTLTASSTPTPSASPSPTGCDWATLPDADRPPLLEDEPEGLPAAREMTDAVWDCVDDSWSVEARSAGGETWRLGGTAQALYLVAPDGDLLKLFDLRTDVLVQVLASDLEARLTWTARMAGGDGYQVVQVELDTGTVVDDWGGDAIPLQQRWNGPREVYSVAPVRPLADGGTLWGGYTYYDALASLFVQGDGGEFSALGAQPTIDALIRDRGVNGAGELGDEIWLDADAAFAAVLVQRPRDGEQFGSAGGTWVVVDLATDQWRLAEASLPSGLCLAASEPVPSGTAAHPGALRASCWNGEDWTPFDLSVEGQPVPR